MNILNVDDFLRTYAPSRKQHYYVQGILRFFILRSIMVFWTCAIVDHRVKWTFHDGKSEIMQTAYVHPLASFSLCSCRQNKGRKKQEEVYFLPLIRTLILDHELRILLSTLIDAIFKCHYHFLFPFSCPVQGSFPGLLKRCMWGEPIIFYILAIF